MRGRKPRPNTLNVIDGGIGRRVAGKPRPPTCPSHLNPSAKTEWKRLAPSLFPRGIIGEADRASLVAYCQAYGRWVGSGTKAR
ncbi:MAG: Terminase [Devosia sp.]|nr:Terminase [Devosia sp.]